LGLLKACQTSSAYSSQGRPKSICTHCVPLRRKMMLESDASLSPSVILASMSEVAFLSLQVTLALGARLTRPRGTIMGGRGLSDIGSMSGLILICGGVPLKAGFGSLISSGTRSPPDAGALVLAAPAGSALSARADVAANRAHTGAT